MRLYILSFQCSDRSVTIGRGDDRPGKDRGPVPSKPITTSSGPLNTARKVLLGSVESRLLEVLKMIAERHGYRLLVARAHDGDHVHLFVSAPPSVCIPEMVRVLKCISAQFLFEEFSQLKVWLWAGTCGLMAMPSELQAL